MNENKPLIKGGYSVEVPGSDWERVIWKVVYDHDFEEIK